MIRAQEVVLQAEWALGEMLQDAAIEVLGLQVGDDMRHPRCHRFDDAEAKRRKSVGDALHGEGWKTADLRSYSYSQIARAARR